MIPKWRQLFPAVVLLFLYGSSSAATPKARTFDLWRQQIKKALFIPENLPAVAPVDYGSFTPAPGVLAERVTYSTLYGLRIPAIVYRPADEKGQRLPGLVIVNGHGGDKTSWYAFYAGILYARAGGVVVTYDPIGEDERNKDRRSASRAHDTFVAGPEMAPRLGGLMITDVMQSVSYLLERPDVDPHRIGILAFSMGTFHSIIAAALDRRVHALLLSGGGNVSGPGDYWDVSPKVMCQSGPYHTFTFLPDRGADLYALNQQRGPTFVMNGTADPLILAQHNDEAFFTQLRDRTVRVSGTRKNLFETYWIQGAGHRPNFVTKPAALWLQHQLHFPAWSDSLLHSMPESHISEWARAQHKGDIPGLQNELGEGGVIALGNDIPYISRDQLQAVPLATWIAQKDDFTWVSWVERAKKAEAADLAQTTHHSNQTSGDH